MLYFVDRLSPGEITHGLVVYQFEVERFQDIMVGRAVTGGIDNINIFTDNGVLSLMKFVQFYIRVRYRPYFSRGYYENTIRFPISYRTMPF